MSADLTRDPALKFERFATAFSEALRSTASARDGRPFEARVALLPESDPPAAPTALGCLVTLQLGGELAGEVQLAAGAELAGRLNAAAVGASATQGQAMWLEFVELLRQNLETALGTLFGAVRIESCRSSTTPEAAPALAQIDLVDAGAEIGKVLLLAGTAMREGLRSAAIHSPITTDMLPIGEGGHLHRVIDVPLAVTLRFGQRQLTLRELLALGTGSLLELDRQVEEPVDLMLGERIVARGEVVIVDGNYGMRVTQVVENVSQRPTLVPH